MGKAALPLAIVGSGALGLFGSSKAAKAQKQAANQAMNAQLAAIEWEKERYYEDVARRKPFYELSLGAIPGLQEYLSGDFDVTKTKEYQVQSEALDRELAKHLSARGLQMSGFGVEEQARLKSGLISNLTNQRFSRLASLLNVGSIGMAQAPGLGQYYSNIGNIGMQQGLSQAQTWQGVSQLPFQLFNAYQWWNFMNKQGLGMTPEMTAWDMFVS